jgi:translocation and assembly module TamB
MGALAWLVMTESGLSSTVILTQKLLPNIVIKNASGRLYDTVYFEQIDYQIDDVSKAQINKLTLNWQATELLAGKLSVRQILVDKIQLTQGNTPPKKNTEFSLPNIALPIDIDLADVQINSLLIHDSSMQKEQTNIGLKAKIRLVNSLLNIDLLHVEQGKAIRFELTGKATLRDRYNTDLSYQWQVSDSPVGDVKATGTIRGDLTELRLKQQLSQPITSTQLIVLNDVLGQLNWGATVEFDKLDLAALLSEPQGELTGFELTASGDLKHADVELHSQLSAPNLPNVAINAKSSTKDFDNWFINAELLTKSDGTLSVKGDINSVSSTPALAIKGNWQQLSWPLGVADKIIVSPNADFTINGSSEHYVISASGNVELEQQAVSFMLNGEGSATQASVTQFDLTGFDGNASITASANWLPSIAEFTLSALWHDIVIPDSLTTIPVASQQGQIEVSGNSESFLLSSTADLNIDKKSVLINAKGKGNTQGFEQLVVHSQLESGKADFEGKLLWQPELALNGKLAVDKLNPAFFASEWPGAVSGDWQMSASKLGDNQVGIEIKKVALSGELRQRPFSIQGELSYLNQVLAVPKLRVDSGRSNLLVNGKMADDIEFEWAIKSPDLSDFYPDLQGQLNATGTVNGTSTSPVVVAKFSAKKLTYQNTVTIDALESDVSLDLNEQGRVQGKLALSNINFEGQKKLNAKLALSGSKNNHQLLFEITSKDSSLSGLAVGNMLEQQWLGKLSRLEINSNSVGQWDMTEAGSIMLAGDHADIEQQCLKSDNGSICLQAHQAVDGHWRSKGTFDAIPVSLFSQFTASLDQLKGKLKGQYELAGQGRYPESGEGSIRLYDGSILVEGSEEGKRQNIAIRDAKLTYQLAEDNSHVAVYIEPDVAGMSAVTGEIDLANIRTIVASPQQAKLRGKLKTSVDDLSAFDALHPEYEQLEGQLKLDMKLAGTVAKPLIAGNIDLADGRVELPSLGIVLSKLELSAQGNSDDDITFNYQADSGEGVLTGEGKFSLADTGWKLQTSLTGDKVEFMNLPEAYVVASPKLSYTMSAQSASIEGQISVPEAELAPLKFNMPVSPSDDVIIIEHSTKAEEKKAFPTKVNVQVIIGDKVNVSGIGFEGRLTGKLLVTGDTSKLLLGTGEIDIKDGNYIAYAQNLEVNDGKILFSGGALDDPDLDIKAIRSGSDYSVGLQLEGSSSSPQMSLFSTPSMSQENILAYLILGHPIAEASVTDAALLATAASGLGLKGGNQMGDHIASTFGLDTVSIKGSGGDDTALEIGKYLSPKLYLGYGVGIFEPVSTVTLLYKLSKIWALKAESGTETGVDFLYTHER